MSQINSAKMLRVAQYFISKYNYQSINVDNRQDELWLFSQENKDYDLIRISCKGIAQVDYEKQRLHASIKVIRDSLKITGRFLDIHVSNDEILENEEFDSIAIEENYYSGIDVKDIFTGLETIVHSVENPQKEIKEISYDIIKKRKAHSSKGRYANFKPVGTISVVVICFIVFLLTQYLQSFQANIGMENGAINAAILVGGYYKGFIVIAHEYWRFLTSGFVHVELWHMLINMLALFNLGVFFERNYGTKNMLLILIGSILGGSVFVFLAADNNITVGISGGLYGLMASMIVHLWYTGMLRQPAIRNQVLSLILLNALITFMPGISMMGHIGGFITGALLSMTLIKSDKLKAFINNAKISLLIGAVIVSYFVVKTDDVFPKYPGNEFAVIELADDLGLDFYADYLAKKVNAFYIKGK